MYLKIESYIEVRVILFVLPRFCLGCKLFEYNLFIILGFDLTGILVLVQG